jgi:predicted phosphodiesterase
MRPISWLHVSDLHVRTSDAWSQDVVLGAMCESIGRQRRESGSPDFVLATGDLGFSGKAEEYRLAERLLGAIGDAGGVPRERIYCVPGNHDIDRERQRMCFQGSRNFAQSPNQVDVLLSSADDLATLLQREENYRNFQNSCFPGQHRRSTGDGLAYVSCVTIDDIRIAIVGLDSAWLAEGGLGDHGKLLVGERQVINALTMAEECDPHILIGMAHHPFHSLQEFDRRPVQYRIERSCQFFHCGHLHEPETRNVVHAGAGCLILAAGASFETRQSRNTYSVVTLDLLASQRHVKVVQYEPGTGTFAFSSSDTYPIDVALSVGCKVGDLASALAAYRPSLSPVAHYLAAVLLDRKAELAIPGATGYTFGSFAVLEAQPDTDLQRRARAFMSFKNVLRVFYGRMPLSDLLARYGNPVERYGTALQEAGRPSSDLYARLQDHERDAQTMATAESQEAASHTVLLLIELAQAQDWALLRSQAERHIASADPAVAIQARRMFALALAQSREPSDKMEAIDQYESLVSDGSANVSDLAALALLLADAGRYDAAKAALQNGIRRFPPEESSGLVEIGLRIVEATGDREFRKELERLVP